MHPDHPLLPVTAAFGALLIVTSWAGPAGAQENGGAEPETPAVRPGGSPDSAGPGLRRGGIPRDWLESEPTEPRSRRRAPTRRDEIEPEPQAQGLEEGVPEFRVRPGFRPPADDWFPPRSDWKLGVYAENTDTGVIVTRVVPSTAAAEVGLEPGDRIVTVGGYQVGFVGRDLYPLGHELQRQAGPRGDVLLLVQNVRNDELLNLDVRLDRGGRRRPAATPE